MSKFHVNPENGNPGKCSAADGNCPFGADAPHFSTKEDAQQAYEMAQGGSFTPKRGIEAPLLTANKTTLNTLLEQLEIRPWQRNDFPYSEVYRDAIHEIIRIKDIGFASKAAREESSIQLKKLADELYEQRNSDNLADSIAARRTYASIIRSLEEHNLVDERSEEERDLDYWAGRYKQAPDKDGYDKYSEEDLDRLETLSEHVNLEDLSDEEVELVSNASYKPVAGSYFNASFSQYGVERARRARDVRQTLTNFDSLPDYVQSALGSKEDLAAKIAELDKGAKDSVGRKKQIADFVRDERERREINARVEKGIADAAK